MKSPYMGIIPIFPLRPYCTWKSWGLQEGGGSAYFIPVNVPSGNYFVASGFVGEMRLSPHGHAEGTTLRTLGQEKTGVDSKAINNTD